MVWYGGRGGFGGGLSPIFAPSVGVLLCAKTVPNFPTCHIVILHKGVIYKGLWNVDNSLRVLTSPI